MLRKVAACLLCTIALGPAASWSQLPDESRSLNEANRLIQSARDTAGENWVDAANFLCAEEQVVGTPAESPIITPTRLFDNLYVVGRQGTVVYALVSSDGIILIDAGYQGQEETVLLPGLRALGLDPEEIRYVLVAHGHRDHFGGSRYLQDRFGAEIFLSEQDWDLVEQSGVSEGTEPPPERGSTVSDGEVLTLGDTGVTAVLIPGHTPGSLGFIFDVRDGSSSHTAGLFGGTILIASRIGNEGLNEYIGSLEHFAEVSASMGVDVEVQNHPIFDRFPEKLDRLGTRTAGEGHPFVVGAAAYQDFLDVIRLCTQAELARRTTGTQGNPG